MQRTTWRSAIAVARTARALTYLAYALVIVALVILLLGFFLLLFGANPDAPFAEWLYRGLTRVMAPFQRLFEPVRLDGNSVLDVSILFAMIVYWIVALVLHAVIEWLTARIVEMRWGRPPDGLLGMGEHNQHGAPEDRQRRIAIGAGSSTGASLATCAASALCDSVSRLGVTIFGAAVTPLIITLTTTALSNEADRARETAGSAPARTAVGTGSIRNAGVG